jgi:ubiquinone/menaquinone biosynthesis C-methylase UbiE
MDKHIKEFYEKIDSGSGAKLNKKKEKIIELINSYGKIKRILDVGAGDGLTLSIINAEEKYGIDINSKNIERLTKKGIKAYLQDVQEPFPFPDNYFDVVVSEDVIEHLFFPEKTLYEIYRVLKPGGIFVGSVPNHFYWYHRLCFLLAKPEKSFLFVNAKHISDNFWTKKGLIKLLKNTGFKIEYFDIINGHLCFIRPTLFGLDMVWKVKK